MHFLNALDDDEFALFQTLLDDHVAALLDPSFDTPLLDLFGVIDHHDIVSGLVELDCGLRYEK